MLEASAATVEERLSIARIEAWQTGKRVRVHAWTDAEARWLSREFNRNIFKFDYVEFGVEVTDR